METLFSSDILAKIAMYYAAIIAIANVITMLFPSVSNNAIYNGIMKVLNFISLNILKNKNADDVKK